MEDYPSTRDYLYSLKNRGSKYGIDRMRLFVESLGHPEKQFPSVHLAGTNGKGSTCAMLEAIFRANGLRTGMYTSPHLVHQGERVQVDRQILQPEAIVAFTQKLKPIAAQLAITDPDDHPSFFEFMTAMAFLRFAEAKVDIALIETGLGGRLDATNVLTPELSIITTISLDHTELLGDTIEQIAAEKAGIIKPGIPVLIGWLPAEAEKVIRERATQLSAPVYAAAERFPTAESLPQTNLNGQFQRRNAALALYAAELLANRFSTTPALNLDALQNVQWRGRWEHMEVDGRHLILDATHNPEGVRELEANLRDFTENARQKPIILTAALGASRAQALIPMLTGYARELILVAPDQERALSPEALHQFVPSDSSIPVQAGHVDLLFPGGPRCTLGKPGDTIIVAGSLYLIGEILERFEGNTDHAQAKLQDRP